jgi:hypothetical protein
MFDWKMRLKFDFDIVPNPKMLGLYTLSLCLKVTNKEDLIHAPIWARFAVVTKKEVTNPWTHVILEKVRKTTWEVIVEIGDKRILTVNCNEDIGPIAEWDMLHNTPTEDNMRAAVKESKRKLELQLIMNKRLEESPNRKSARYHTYIIQKSGGHKMKDDASKCNGEIKVGCVVQVTLKNMDTTKVDGKNLTLVVVEKVTHVHNTPPKYPLACTKGPMQNLYSRTYITVVKDGCSKTLGLKSIFSCWKGKAAVTEREAAASTLMVGGQGVKRCSCCGLYDTKHCACKKMG